MGRKKGKLITRLLIAFIILALVLGVLVVLGRNQVNQYQTKIDDLQYQIDSTQQTVYVANGDIDANTQIQQDINVMQQKIATGLDPSQYLTADDLTNGKYTSLVKIATGTPIMKNMVTSDDVTNGNKEVEINIAELLVDSKANDVVDMRIAFPDGSDYCVLSKKTMKNLIYNSSVWYTDLNEQEILTLTSAIVDAYTNTGTYIYLTRYTDPSIQDASQCNYPVNQIAHDIVNGSAETSDPNIDRTSDTYTKMTETLNLLARNRLQEKLASLTPEQLQAVAAGRALQDTSNATAYAGMSASIEAANEAASEASANGTTAYDASGTSSSTDGKSNSSGTAGEEASN